MTWIESIARLHSGIDLEPHEVSSIMQTILEGRAEVSDIKEFLLALKKKGESSDEVSALVAEMFRYSSPISITDRSVDTVGTGGDGAQTIIFRQLQQLLPPQQERALLNMEIVRHRVNQVQGIYLKHLASPSHSTVLRSLNA